MLRKLTPEEIASLLEHHPEQSKFDCKRTLNLRSEHEKGEFVKDVVGVANAHGDETGYLLYGVDLQASDPIHRNEQSIRRCVPAATGQLKG